MNNKGFTLVELMLTSAVAGVLILGLMMVWSNSYAGLSDIEASNAITEILQDTRMSLNSEDGCTRNLGGTALAMSNLKGAVVTQVTRNAGSGLPGSVIMKVGQIQEGFEIRDIRLKPVNQPDLSFVVADLELTYRKVSGYGTNVAERRIGIVAQVQGGRVQKCWIRKDNDMKAGNQMCLANSGGALNELNRATRACGLTNGKWFGSGSPFKATCPKGTVLPLKANPDFNCQMMPPSGFVDMNNANGNAFGASLDLKTQSCSCVYDVTIPAAVMKTFTCQVLCVVL